MNDLIERLTLETHLVERETETETDLIGELSDALHQVLVGLPVSSYQLPHHGNHLEGVAVIQPASTETDTFSIGYLHKLSTKQCLKSRL